MRQALLILLGLLIVTWFEFQIYPGHTYLQGETQLLVPMLERLDTPGFLSRDLVAANPTFAYTVYDEITEALHVSTHLSFKQVLVGQQALFRFAAVLGMFLIARALRVSPWSAVLLSASVNAITHLSAPDSYVSSPEATPVSFAFSLVILAGGLMVNRNPLLSGLAGGLALIYNPMTGAAFWLVVLFASIADDSLRSFLRPVWPSLLIFLLILGNLVQWQAGLGAGQELGSHMSDTLVRLTQFRTPWVWVSHWFARGILTYVFLMTIGLCALTTMWTELSRITKWITLGLVLSGLVWSGLAALLCASRLQVAVQMSPATNLSFTVAVSVILCGAASWHQAFKKRWLFSIAAMTFLVGAVLNAEVLSLLHAKTDLAHDLENSDAVEQVAVWADQNTWGSSLFQFPDAGEHITPGTFRALSRRALWADWQSGRIADYSEQAGLSWWARWQNLQHPYSPIRLKTMLPLPIDYYVLKTVHRLAGVKAVYANSEYVVYDAQDLREGWNKLKASAETSLNN